MSAQTAAEILEEASDVVEDTIDLMERKVSWVSQNPKTLASIALVAGAAIGGGVVFLVVRKRLELKAEARITAVTEDVKNHYSAIHKSDTTLSAMAEKYPDEEKAADISVVESIVVREGYTSYDKAQEVAAVVEGVQRDAEEITVTQAIVEATTMNIFESYDPERYFNFREELERRENRPDDPHVITEEEFNLGERDFAQTSLTYYDEDDVLTDDKDAPVTDVEKVVGSENLLRFGHGSGSPNVVHVRNPRLELDMEITQSEGSYAQEVLGYSGGELQHSEKRVQRKFRNSDE